MAENKITTHVLNSGWFMARINGLPLIGNNGCYSRFPSRKEAREAAKQRLQQLGPDERKELGLA